MKNNIPSNLFNLSLILLILLFSTTTFSQIKKVNYKILGINVEGNKSADANTVIANSGLRVGDEIEIPGDNTSKAIKRLYGLNVFEDVKILIDKKIDMGVFLLIKVEEYSRVEKIVVEGNDELSEEEIIEKASFFKGQTLKQQELYRVKGEIKKLYDEEGYLNAKIEPLRFIYAEADTSDDEIVVTWKNENDYSDQVETYYDYDPDNKYDVLRKVTTRILVVFRIDEGDEVTIRKIEFVGNEQFDDDELKGELAETKEDRWWRFWSGANLNKEEFKTDKELLNSFYQKQGYRDFEIIGDTLLYDEENQDVRIILSVNEGLQYKIRNINWEGNSIYPDEILDERLGLKDGDVYDFEKFKQNLFGNEKQNDVSALYMDAGYLGFRAMPAEDKVSKDSIDVNIRILENNRFKIGKVEIEGNDKTKDKVIRRELYTIPSDYFSRSLLIRSIQQLANLQYFNVERLYQDGAVPSPANDSTVNVKFTVEEKSSDYLNASVGYSGSWGMSGSIGITLTNFSISEPFSMGGGQILNFNWQFGVGNYYRTFTLGFTEPWFMDTPTMVGFDMFDTRQRYIYDLRQTGITGRVGRRLRWPDSYFYLQGSLKYQHNDVINGGYYYREGKTDQVTLGVSLSRNDIDNPIFPSRGSRISLNAELTGGPFLPGNVDYLKVQFKTEVYKSLFNSRKLAFFASTDLGYIDELVKDTYIQPFEFFYMGGNGLVIATTPLRGYDDRSVGPRGNDIITNDIIGGRVMAKFTAEFRAALALEPMPIWVLAFAEAGNTWLNMQSADIFNLRRSAGFGARIMINPIGVIGFDYGYGFDRKAVDGMEPTWEFHFQFGRGQ
ncbi:MAG: outer membrane protein assembly factor BamA [Melioribacteraceae bacterium]|nr:outer membrane protein assembly factor BamA [Melioribacteraceae bacterium]